MTGKCETVAVFHNNFIAKVADVVVVVVVYLVLY